jgi:hypothetical protein
MMWTPPVPVDDLPFPCAFTPRGKKSTPRIMNKNRCAETKRRDVKPGMKTSLKL